MADRRLDGVECRTVFEDLCRGGGSILFKTIGDRAADIDQVRPVGAEELSAHLRGSRRYARAR
ncbi:MAG: hypothetical protein AAGA32_16115 [Pseudomonadota bacterium]